jgi:hypothetical protein
MVGWGVLFGRRRREKDFGVAVYILDEIAGEKERNSN